MTASPDQDPESYAGPERKAPGLETIAIASFLVGLVLWFGGGCFVLNGGGDGRGGAGPSRPAASTPLVVRGTPTRLPDRTSCDEIRGTDYRSEAERQFFLANCRPIP